MVFRSTAKPAQSGCKGSVARTETSQQRAKGRGKKPMASPHVDPDAERVSDCWRTQHQTRSQHERFLAMPTLLEERPRARMPCAHFGSVKRCQASSYD